TSNICTAQVLLAVMAGMYAVWHGPAGIERIARRVAVLTATLREALAGFGLLISNENQFDTLLIDSGAHTGAIVDAAQQVRVNLRQVGDSQLAVSLDET